jgi:type II secretory pathway component PulK
MMRPRHHSRSRRGGALLAVMWLSAALSAIALTLAMTVRAELERAAGAVDSAQAYFLAQGAIEHFLFQLEASGFGPDAGFRPGQRRMSWRAPSGTVDLQITGENGKLNLYMTQPAVLARLFAELGVEPGLAEQIAAGIAARRSQNLRGESSFSSQLPSFLELEDLLMIPGVAPDIYYGFWEREPEGRLVQRGGIAQHLTLLDAGGINANYASPAVLRAAGVPEGPLEAILQAREARPIEDVARFGVGSLPGGSVLSGGGAMAYTVRATAQLNGRPVRRSVEAVVRFGKNPNEPTLGIVRWYPVAN